MAKRFISDEEMAALESGGSVTTDTMSPTSQPTIPQPQNKAKSFFNTVDKQGQFMKDISVGVGKHFAESGLNKLSNPFKILAGGAAPAWESTVDLANRKAVSKYEDLLQQALKEKDPNKKEQLLSQARATQAGISDRGKATGVLSGVFEGPKNLKVGDATIGERLQAKNLPQTLGKITGAVGEFAAGSKLGLGKAAVGSGGVKAVSDISDKLSKGNAVSRIVGEMYKVMPDAVGAFASSLAMGDPGTTKEESDAMIKQAVASGLITVGTAGVIQTIKEGGNLLKAVGQKIAGWTTGTGEDVMKKAGSAPGTNKAFDASRWGKKAPDEPVDDLRKVVETLDERIKLIDAQKNTEFIKKTQELAKIKIDTKERLNAYKDVQNVAKKWWKSNQLGDPSNVGPDADETLKVADNIWKKVENAFNNKNMTASNLNKLNENLSNLMGDNDKTNILIKNIQEYINKTAMVKAGAGNANDAYMALKAAKPEMVKQMKEINKLVASGDNEKAIKKMIKLFENSDVLKKELVEIINDIDPDIVSKLQGWQGRAVVSGGSIGSINRMAVTVGSFAEGPFLKNVLGAFLITSPKVMTNFFRGLAISEKTISALNKVVSQTAGYPSIIPGIMQGTKDKKPVPFMSKTNNETTGKRFISDEEMMKLSGEDAQASGGGYNMTNMLYKGQEGARPGKPKSNEPGEYFAEFQSEDDNIRAVGRDMEAKLRDKPDMTLRQLINIWSPAVDENNPNQILKTILDELYKKHYGPGDSIIYTGNTKVRDIISNPSLLKDFVYAVAVAEHGDDRYRVKNW